MLAAVVDIVERQGLEAWLVGGSVRDRVLGLDSPDLDLVVAGEPVSLARELARKTRRPWFTLSERHHACRVMGDKGHVDIAALRGAGILEDLAQRDFTVNAMAIPVGKRILDGGAGRADQAAANTSDALRGLLIDPFGGFAHLQAKRLVAVSDRIFRDDPLRLLRATRFAHALGFSLEEELRELIRTHAFLLPRVSPERVASEIVLTLEQGRGGEALRLWGRLGLLGPLVPELGEAEGTAGEWTAALLDRLEEMAAAPGTFFPEAGQLLVDRLRQRVDGMVGRRVALLLAGWLGRHEPALGCRVVTRLRFSDRVLSLIQTAGRLGATTGGGLPSPESPSRPGRAAIRYLWAAAPWEPEVILLAAAAQRIGGDGRVRKPGMVASTSAGGEDPARSLMALWARRAVASPREVPVDGHALMRELGLPPGPELGRVLLEVKLAWEAGEIREASGALALARQCLASLS